VSAATDDPHPYTWAQLPVFLHSLPRLVTLKAASQQATTSERNDRFSYRLNGRGNLVKDILAVYLAPPERAASARSLSCLIPRALPPKFQLLDVAITAHRHRVQAAFLFACVMPCYNTAGVRPHSI